MQDRPSSPVIRFSEFIGIGYFGDKNQHVIAPIFDGRKSAETAWTHVMKSSIYHVIFIAHTTKYEFIGYPLEIKPNQVNHVLYRSFSSLGSLQKFKSAYGGTTFIKFGWHDLTKPHELDVLSQYATVDSVEFKRPEEIKQGTLVDRVRMSSFVEGTSYTKPESDSDFIS